jgi:hypothetical protein
MNRLGLGRLEAFGLGSLGVIARPVTAKHVVTPGAAYRIGTIRQRSTSRIQARGAPTISWRQDLRLIEPRQAAQALTVSAEQTVAAVAAELRMSAVRSEERSSVVARESRVDSIKRERDELCGPPENRIGTPRA